MVLLMGCVQQFYLLAQSGITFKGKVVENEKGNPVPFAVIGLKEINIWQVSSVLGEFEVNNIPPGQYTLEATCLGFSKYSKQVTVRENMTVYPVKMDVLSLSLDEVIVTAQEQTQGSTSTIGQTALQHIQPISLADVFELLPGGEPQDLEYEEFPSMSMRQVGNDETSTLGLAVVVDGVALDNDLNRQVPAGGDSDSKGEERYSQGKGIDLREISTDEIETIEIVKGVSSAEYGDMTSGLVKITRKIGRTPFTARVKSSGKQKLFYLGKGFSLSRGGNLNIGGNYLNYKADPRNDLENYQRITGSLRYKKNYRLTNGQWELKSFCDFTGTIEKEKDDSEQLDSQEDEYSSSYSKIIGHVGIKWLPESATGWTHELKISGTYSHDELFIAKKVSTGGAMAAFTSTTEGRHRSSYLPTTYYAEHRVDGKPFMAHVDYKSAKFYNWLGTIQELKFGASYSYQKNYGEGQVFDVEAPVYYSSSTRPYTYYDIPAAQKLFAFVESRQHYKIGNHKMMLQAGVRLYAMPGLGGKYAMQNSLYPDPRINLTWKLPKLKNGLKIFLHGAYGWHTKLPVNAFIYKNKLYKDIIELNYYSQTESLRSLFILTNIVDPVNYQIEPAVNKKIESGVTISYKKTFINLTAFYEKCNNGFYSQKAFKRYDYRSYDYSDVDASTLTAPLDTTGLPYTTESKYYLYTTQYNNRDVEKKGLEYVINFPRWDFLATRLSVSGAWYRSSYDISGERYYKPNVVVNNEAYPYIGVYNYYINRSKAGMTKEQLTTMFRFDTHIKKIRLIISNLLFVKWYLKEQYHHNTGLPIAYYDREGTRHAFSSDLLEDDSLLEYLVNTYSDTYFDPEIEPIFISLNQKLTKEIGDKMRISFYVNNLIGFQPEYKLKSGTTHKEYYKPYFGAEMNLKF